MMLLGRMQYYLLGFVLICAGCQSTEKPVSTPPRVTAEACIPEQPMSQEAASLSTLYQKYYKYLKEIFINIGNRFGDRIKFFNYSKERGISCVYFSKEKENGDIGITAAVMSNGHSYNGRYTDYNQRAVDNINNFALPILRIMRESKIIEPANIRKLQVVVAWSVSTSSRYHDESVIVSVPVNVFDQYQKSRITSQEMFNRSRLIGVQADNSLGRIEIDMRRGM